MSPPTKMSSTVVWYVTGSAIGAGPLNSTASSLRRSPQTVPCPTERITLLQGIVIVSLSSYNGSKRPSAFLTCVHFLNTIPVTFPFSVSISFGPQPPWNFIPSDSASSISSGRAGMISRVSSDT